MYTTLSLQARILYSDTYVALRLQIPTPRSGYKHLRLGFKYIHHMSGFEHIYCTQASNTIVLKFQISTPHSGFEHVYCAHTSNTYIVLALQICTPCLVFEHIYTVLRLRTHVLCSHFKHLHHACTSNTYTALSLQARILCSDTYVALRLQIHTPPLVLRLQTCYYGIHRLS
jgi:hypothetical protein